MKLYHGSPAIVEHPQLAYGKATNDYGQAFYCTQDRELACEWACPRPAHDGYCNEYNLATDGLHILDLDTCEHGVLTWIATLMANRRVKFANANTEEVKAFITAYAADLSAYDVVEGYRADDSYFQIARSFVTDGVPLEKLDACLRLGNLGRQVALRSQKAIDALVFVDAHRSSAATYYPARNERNAYAAHAFTELHNQQKRNEDTYFIDIIRSLS